MDNVGVVVDDLAAAVAFFKEPGLDLEGEAQVEGPSVDRQRRAEQRPAEHAGHTSHPSASVMSVAVRASSSRSPGRSADDR
jgi:hypothetical protein